LPSCSSFNIPGFIFNTSLSTPNPLASPLALITQYRSPQPSLYLSLRSAITILIPALNLLAIFTLIVILVGVGYSAYLSVKREEETLTSVKEWVIKAIILLTILFSILFVLVIVKELFFRCGSIGCN
jgi:hypothetical protein